MSQLETQYQSLLENKLIDAYNNTKGSASKGKGLDKETRLQLESRLAEIERDYMLKTKHENILEMEVWNLKAAHEKEIQSLRDNFEQEIAERVKETHENEQ